MPAGEQRLTVCRMGRLDYVPSWDLQRALQNRLIRAKRSEPKEDLTHVMLLVEHPPVYTLGKSGDPDNLLLNADELSAQGASFVHIDRGGDITYHGPGQLVGYPILDLDRFYRDIHRYLRDLEETIIRTCTSYGLQAGRIRGRTGVWIGTEQDGLERKISAMGIRCSRWVTMHGFAFNLNTSLDRYEAIIPCGIRDRGVTSLAKELGHAVDEMETQDLLLAHFEQIFGMKARVLERAEAVTFLETYLDDETATRDAAWRLALT